MFNPEILPFRNLLNLTQQQPCLTTVIIQLHISDSPAEHLTPKPAHMECMVSARAMIYHLAGTVNEFQADT